MATDSDSLKWLHFSGYSKDFPTWSTRFAAFMQTKGLYITPIGNEGIIRRPDSLPESPSDEQQRDYTIKVEEKEDRNITVWCYLALTLHSTTLMTIRHDCVNADRLGKSEAAWKCVLNCFHSYEAPTVVSNVSPLARLKMSEGEGNQNVFIRAPKFFNRIRQARKTLNALILTGLLEQSQQLIEQESFNPSGDYTDIRQRLLNYSVGKEQKLEQSASHVEMSSKSFSRATGNNEGRKDGKRAVTCFVCGLLCHIAQDCGEKEDASCIFCKQKGHLETVSRKKRTIKA